MKIFEMKLRDVVPPLTV